jgi:trehalose 6-phosphate phosphatase
VCALSSPRNPDLNPRAVSSPPGASGDWALFLDIDGTLLDIAPEPDLVVLPAELPKALLAAAAALNGALALVSGRSIAWIDRLFDPLRLPVAGQHGAEIRMIGDHSAEAVVPVPDLLGLRGRAAEIAATIPGVLLEEKTFGVAVHYRNAPQAGPELCNRLKQLVAELGDPFALFTGKMVFEVRSAVAWKERAVEAFMATAPFAGRKPVYIGDDVTDQDAFRAARRRGGYAIQVGPGPLELVDWYFDKPSAVRDWLAQVPAHVAEARDGQ